MSSYDDAVQQLKKIHTILRKNGWSSYNIERDTYMSMDSENRNEMDRNFKFMREEGWITPHTPCVGLPVSYALTSQGIKVAEDIVEKPVIQQTHYHVTNATNSIIGDGASNNTFNVGFAIEDLQLLVEKNLSDREERKELLTTLNNLFGKIESNQPLEKGFLSKISDKLQNYSWLSSPVTALILRYLTSPSNS
jgi:hypothetical protein